MDDSTRISNLKGFMVKQKYLLHLKYQIAIIDDTPMILFDELPDKVRGLLSDALNRADLLYIQVAQKPKKQSPSNKK